MNKESFIEKYDKIKEEYESAQTETDIRAAIGNSKLVFNALQMVYEYPDDYELIVQYTSNEKFGYEFEIIVRDYNEQDSLGNNVCLLHIYSDTDVNGYHINKLNLYEECGIDMPCDGKSHYNNEYFREYKSFLQLLINMLSDQSKEFKTWLALKGLSGLIKDGEQYGTK